MGLNQSLIFPSKHTLVAYVCHLSPKLTISIYRPGCASGGNRAEDRTARERRGEELEAVAGERRERRGEEGSRLGKGQGERSGGER